MFGVVIPPGVDVVRISALSGKKGKPPCLWEGPPSTDQGTIEAAIGRDPRIVRWLRKSGMVRSSVATVNVQIECYSQGRRVESIEVADVSLLVAGGRRRQVVAADEVAVRAYDLAETTMELLKSMLDERDTVIGRLVERGLKMPEQPKEPPPEPADKSDVLDELLNKGTKFLALANGFRSLQTNNE